MKRDIDLYKPEENVIPPSCLVAIYGKVSIDTEEYLSCIVPLSGITSDAQKIHIFRFLQTETSGM